MTFLLIFLLVVLTILTLKIRIKILKVHFSSAHKHTHINKNYKFVIQFYVLGFLPISQIRITKDILEKLKVNKRVLTLEEKILSNPPKFDIDLLDTIKKLKFKISQLDFKIEIGTENASITAFIIPIISTILAFILRKPLKNNNEIFYIVKPLFINQNVLNMQLSGIFEVKLIHIISIIYILNKKKGVKNYERTSNRGSYDYGYE